MSRGERMLVTLAVMTATVMQVLDTTIVNVALPHMEGALGATPDEISWVLTSYLIASAIFMPLTGYFTDRLGRRRYFVASIVGFTLFSALCGLSQTLDQIVLFRLLQGAFGAALVPVSLATLVATYPAEERGRAMAFWGVGIMVGPVLGPTLGGYLTEVLSWRWTFYINVPVGFLSAFLALTVLPDTPRRPRGIDWGALALAALAIGSMQFVLDRGNRDDWFSSSVIQLAAVLSVAGLAAFLWRSLRQRAGRLFDLKIFADRNFSTAALMLATTMLGLYGMLVMQPLLMESILGYPVLTTGLVMAPRGLASMISMMIVGRVINRVRIRTLILIGIVLAFTGTYFATYYSLQVDLWWLLWPTIVQGLGLGMVTVPLATLAYSTLPPRTVPEATGLFSLIRTIGASVGIAIVTTVFTRQTEVAWNQIGGFLNPFNPALARYLGRLHLGVHSAAGAELLAGELGRQATMLAFVDVAVFLTWCFAAMLPLLLLFRERRGRAAVSAAPGPE